MIECDYCAVKVMKISELIIQLQRLQRECGDISVVTFKNERSCDVTSAAKMRGLITSPDDYVGFEDRRKFVVVIG